MLFKFGFGVFVCRVCWVERGDLLLDLANLAVELLDCLLSRGIGSDVSACLLDGCFERFERTPIALG